MKEENNWLFQKFWKSNLILSDVQIINLYYIIVLSLFTLTLQVISSSSRYIHLKSKGTVGSLYDCEEGRVAAIAAISTNYITIIHQYIYNNLTTYRAC